MREEAIGNELLAWYDANARILPWRVAPGSSERADPYRVWMSEIMLQQTTVAAVKAYFERFTALWPTVGDLAAAEDSAVMGEWAGLGYYARARNLLKCARAVVADHGGAFPDTEEGLLTLPGIGPYTAAAIASIAFNRPAPVMDGNIERVMSRLFRVEEPLPTSKPVLKDHATRLTPTHRPGDHAQALMDLGATICTPKSPACGICPLMSACAARKAGIAAELPRKLPKKAKPTRLGYVYVARRADGALLLETRPDKGLLGGMLAFPTSEWSDAPTDTPPLDTQWHDPSLEVRHTFTHFHLRLALRIADAPQDVTPHRGTFVPFAQFSPSTLPTVFRKAFDLGRGVTVDAASAKG
ncbi:A/G-specific adenine glycosylase [Gymnodinialimonas hymeniacidonis]|uniref:A/G-specific adenine glycosylase n=1 Tax=Gymnodinialimonas hymeniacidonis TaxID=3126508 RepID=UPI0034C6BA79